MSTLWVTNVTIGDRLQAERNRLGLNQTEFAALGGVSKASQVNYEKGERSPDANYLSGLADAGVDVLYVLTGVKCAVELTSTNRSHLLLAEQIERLPADLQQALQLLLAALVRNRS